jgi:hypothetical protein
MSYSWDFPNFDPAEWDELGQNKLTLQARKWVHGEEPVDNYALLLLAMDLEFCHKVIDNLRKKTTRLEKLAKRLQGKAK